MIDFDEIINKFADRLAQKLWQRYESYHPTHIKTEVKKNHHQQIKGNKQRLTANEAAEILGVKPETLAVWRCVKRYKLPYYKIGSKVFYRKKDIEEFIESRMVGNKTTTEF